MRRLAAVVMAGLILVSCQQTDSDEPASTTTSDPSTDLDAATTTIAPTTSTPPAASTSSSTTTTTTTADTNDTGGEATCDIPQGEPFVGEVEEEVVDLGELAGARVEGVVYPHPDYEGNPWSHWGQGLVLPDGRFLSAIGDHIGEDGNSYIYEYDPQRKVLTMIGDVLSYVDHEPGSWGYGKVHGQIVPGPCGEAYLSTYWGTFRGLEFGGSYTGDVLMRIDPFERTMSTLGVPVPRHGSPSLAGSAPLGLIYGEAVDPLVRADGSEGPFYVYDVRDEQVVYEESGSHTGYRNIMVDAEGRAYFATGDSRLAVYDPTSNDVGAHWSGLPGDWLRASTTPAADGRVYGATRDPDRFFVMQPSGEIEDLGSAAGYTASMAISADGDSFYYMPDAHGRAWESGAPLIEVDGLSGDQNVVVELNPMVEDGLGYTVGGTYNVAISPDGDTVYVGANVSPPGDDSGFGEVVLLIVHLP